MAKDEVLNLRVPSDVKAALKHVAEADDRSVSSLALKIIREWLADRGAPTPKGTRVRRARPRSSRR
jgi:hypothetical protein